MVATRNTDDPAAPVLSVQPRADGVWSVNEEGPEKQAVSYFPSKYGAIRHAIRAAKARSQGEVRVLDGKGAVESRRAYAEDRPPRSERRTRSSRKPTR